MRRNEHDANKWLSDSRYERRYNRDIPPPAPFMSLVGVMWVMFCVAAATVLVVYGLPAVQTVCS